MDLTVIVRGREKDGRDLFIGGYKRARMTRRMDIMTEAHMESGCGGDGWGWGAGEGEGIGAADMKGIT